ncbi:MAG TPA: ABC transporter ATP-binding protein, partial [Herpetosiphonaceae bacterium]
MKVWQFVIQLARPRAGLYIFHGFLWLVFYLVAAASGIVVQSFFDALTGAPSSLQQVWIIVGLLVAVALLRSIMHLVSNIVEYILYATFVIRLRKNVFEDLLYRSGHQALPSSPGEAISRFRDDADELALLTNLSVEVAGKLIFLVFTIGVMASINLWITVIVILPLHAIMLLINLASSRIKTYRRARRQAVGKVTGFLGEIFGAVQAVKVAHAERHVVTHFSTLNEARRKATLRDQLLAELLNSTYLNTVNVSTGIIMLLAGPLMLRGAFTVGDFALFITYLGGIAYLINSVGSMAMRYRQGEVALERMTTLI